MTGTRSRGTRELQRFIAERAHRQLFARARTKSVPRLRSRIVDCVAYESEQQEWEQWHSSQVRAEQGHEKAVGTSEDQGAGGNVR